MRFCFEVHIFSLLIQTAERSDKDSKEPQAHLGDSRHQPHGLLGVGQEDFGHDGHEDVEDLVAGVAHPGNELREGGEELVRRQVVAVLDHHRVYLAQLLPHLSVRTPRWWLHSDTESVFYLLLPPHNSHSILRGYWGNSFDPLFTHLSHARTLWLRNPATVTACEAWPGICTGSQTAKLWEGNDFS